MRPTQTRHECRLWTVLAVTGRKMLQSIGRQILDYFHAHDYVLVGKYLRVDNDN